MTIVFLRWLWGNQSKSEDLIDIIVDRKVSSLENGR